MINNSIFTCNNCGNEIELSADAHADGDKCRECNSGTYQKSGEAYDQEWLDQQQYERDQDQEYEERHKND